MLTAKGPGMPRWFPVGALLLSIFCADTQAHPVTQGGMVVTVAPQKLTIRVTVALEEVLIASAYATDGAGAKSADEAGQRYGPYLLAHLRVHAEGRRLQGNFVQR